MLVSTCVRIMMKIYYKIAIIVSPIITIIIICTPSSLSTSNAQKKEFNFIVVGGLDCDTNSKQTINNIIDKKPWMVVILDILILALSDSYGILHAVQGEDSIDLKFWS